MSGRAADRLDQRRFAAQEAFLVGVKDADHRDFGKVEPFAEQVDADERVEGSLAKLGEDRTRSIAFSSEWSHLQRNPCSLR